MTDIKWTAASAVVLYLCKLIVYVNDDEFTNTIVAPFLVDYVYKLI